jgi:hypothetical protein
MNPDWIAAVRHRCDRFRWILAPRWRDGARGVDAWTARHWLSKAAQVDGWARPPVQVFVRLTRAKAEVRAKQRRARPGSVRGGHTRRNFIGPSLCRGPIYCFKTRFSALPVPAGGAAACPGVDTLVLAADHQCCVASSAWDASSDFHVFIAEDACAAYEEALHDYA